jgi:rhomboid family GlyGly-CTERM serine protease
MRNNAENTTFIRYWAWLLVAGGALVMLQGVISLYPPLGQGLEWSRAEMADGQWWRLLTGHWIHLGFVHLALNLGGLALLPLLFGRSLPGFWAVGYLLAAPLGISLGLVWAVPQLDWYRGFSGCLHGLFVFMALAGLRQQPLWHGLLLAGMALKLGFEAIYPTGTASFIGAAVIYQAHWLGAMTGLVAGALFFIRQQWRLKE